jgi:hypothetical protein
VDGLVSVAADATGAISYAIDLPPEALPPVTGRDLSRAWDAARTAARASRWGVSRGFRFRHADGSYLDFAIADRDAQSWASAVDAISGLQTSYGLSLCLRLLALIDLLARAPWISYFLSVRGGTADLHPHLLHVAATVPLTAEARFDEDGLRARLSTLASAAGATQ